MKPLLSVENLSVDFATSTGPIHAVQGFGFSMRKGETVAIVGESGSGKSTVALALLRLIGYGSTGRIVSGRVMFDDIDLLQLDDAALRDIRGGRIGMIFQDPMMALNPVYTIGRQIAEPLMLHRRLGWSAALLEAVDLLRLVGIPAPEQRVTQYPHNLSGGMRQRVMIAMALACRPDLLIADEPTTALDVTVQAQVLDLINGLKQKLGMAVLLITHDLGVVWETAQRVIVMYAGRKVEEGPVETLFRAPLHPYTSGLLAAATWAEEAGGRLPEIPGTVPSAADMPTGCAFAPRCPHAIARCRQELPTLRAFDGDRQAACFVAGDEG